MVEGKRVDVWMVISGLWTAGGGCPTYETVPVVALSSMMSITRFTMTLDVRSGGWRHVLWQVSFLDGVYLTSRESRESREGADNHSEVEERCWCY